MSRRAAREQRYAEQDVERRGDAYHLFQAE
jgi:hypothetical protein